MLDEVLEFAKIDSSISHLRFKIYFIVYLFHGLLLEIFFKKRARDRQSVEVDTLNE